MRDTVPHRSLIATAMAGLIASLLAGCGGGGSSSSSSTTAAGTPSGSATTVCADITSLQSAANDLKQLDVSTASVIDLKQAILNIAVSAQPLDSSASQATGQAQKDLKAATNKFESQLSSAVDQPVSQRVVTVGKALSQFENGLSQTKAQFNCNQ